MLDLQVGRVDHPVTYSLFYHPLTCQLFHYPLTCPLFHHPLTCPLFHHPLTCLLDAKEEARKDGESCKKTSLAAVTTDAAASDAAREGRREGGNTAGKKREVWGLEMRKEDSTLWRRKATN